jgi:hypothetical protein
MREMDEVHDFWFGMRLRYTTLALENDLIAEN